MARRTGTPAARGSLLAALVLVAPTPAAADPGGEAPPGVERLPGVEGLTAERFAGGGFRLESWLYLPAGGPKELTPPPVSPDWQAVSPWMPAGGVPADWTGSGWFSVELDVAPELAGRTLALTFGRHQGASRVYVDGALAAEIGVLAADPGSAVPAWNAEPLFFTFAEAGRHRIAVRFSSPQMAAFHRVGYPGGFSARLAPAEAAAARFARRQRVASGQRGLFTGIFLSFALLHALLFAFRREARENLYFAAFCTCLAILAFLIVHRDLVPDPRMLFWAEPTMNAAGVAFAVFGVLFVHRVFGRGVPRAVRWAAPLAAAVLVWGVLRPADSMSTIFLTMLAALVEMARAVVMAVVRREPGARLVGFGIVAVAGGFGAGLLAHLGVLPAIPQLTFMAPFVSVLLLIVSMSIYLSQRFALTHSDLERQLVTVRELSEEKLAQERRMHGEQVRRRLAEAEVERKAQELEEARRLQLSLLPRSLPELAGVELAVHMSTATEVGGDYYDFDVADDGTLTLAVGDATGHGMRAGTMVTATKSLFNALSHDPDLVATVRRSNLAIKRMNWRALNMALLLAKLKDGRLRVSAAGMPFPLVYRARPGEIESIEVGGMPLGSMRAFPYRQVAVELADGDTVLFMSDGFPERLNPDGELLGYERAGEIFLAAAARPAQSVVDELVAAGDAWAAGVQADDDVTFVVLKVGQPGEAA